MHVHLLGMDRRECGGQNRVATVSVCYSRPEVEGATSKHTASEKLYPRQREPESRRTRRGSERYRPSVLLCASPAAHSARHTNLELRYRTRGVCCWKDNREERFGKDCVDTWHTVDEERSDTFLWRRRESRRWLKTTLHGPGRPVVGCASGPASTDRTGCTPQTTVTSVLLVSMARLKAARLTGWRSFANFR